MSLIWRAYGWVSRLRLDSKDRMNKRRVAACGERTVIHGYVDVRGAKSDVRIGKDCTILGTLVVEHDAAAIDIGNNVFVGANTLIDCASRVVIEDDVLVSYQCLLMDSDNHSMRAEERVHDLRGVQRGDPHPWEKIASKPIRLCRGAWIGARAIILKGVTVGEGAVVGAGSVVTRDVAPHTAVAGNPARVIREIGVGK